MKESAHNSIRRERTMRTFNMILYPFGLAITAMLVVTLIGMATFGLHSADWLNWQNELISSIGTVAGLAGAVIGLWLAIRAERRAIN
jgi:hypothetical protein